MTTLADPATLPTAHPPASAGAAWVARYLEPFLRSRVAQLPAPLRCLQLWADDDEEAGALRARGHACTVLMPGESPATSMRWSARPVVGSGEHLPFRADAFDLVFTSAFARLAQTPAARAALACELARVTRPGGAMLLSVGNRWCPLDLQSRDALVHGPWHAQKASLGQMEAAFAAARIARIERLSLDRQFGWSRARGPLRLAVGAVSAYLHCVSAPGWRTLYASPLNPVLMLCMTR